MKRIFVICDIFGRTKAFERLCKNFLGEVCPVDPYDGQDMRFDTEAQAYGYFMSHAGLDAYAEHIFNILLKSNPQASVIAFSVGASALWKISDRPELRPIQKAVCFYGSQIRHFQQVTPVFETQLIFPESEPHFNVDDLIEKIEYKKGVTCTKATGLHGFMNESSRNFDPGLYQKHLKECLFCLK